METQPCVCRNVRKKDYKKIEDLIIKAWEYKEWCENKIYGRLIAKVYLNQLLARQTLTKVVEYENEVVAVMMGRCEKLFKKRKSILYLFKMYFYCFLLLFVKGGVQEIKYGSIVEKTNKELYRKAKRNFDGELVLLIVDEKMRGKKLGNKLLYDFINYMKENNAEYFYILTDSSCNYRFYERTGFKKLNEKNICIPSNNEKEKYFLYQCNVAVA